MKKIRILSPVFIGGDLADVDDVVDVEASLAARLVASGRAEFVREKRPKPSVTE